MNYFFNVKFTDIKYKVISILNIFIDKFLKLKYKILKITA